MKALYFLLFCILPISNILMAMDFPHIICAEKGTLFGDMQKGPMNPDWFYTKIPLYQKINQFHELRQWKEAAQGYKNIKNEVFVDLKEYAQSEITIYQPTDQEITYAKHMCNLNEAICCMAQRLPHSGWKSFDYLINIPEAKRISLQEGENYTELRDTLVKVRTDKVGIGDIFHYMYAATLLKQSTGCHIVFCVRDFLKNALSGFAMASEVTLIGENEKLPQTDYETHLIALLGHLALKPGQVVPPRVLLTAPERAMVAVAQQINPLLALGKTILTGFLGENRQATLMGGKLLNGRNLDSEPFKELLARNLDLILMDAGTKDSRVSINENQKHQYIQLVPEKHSFDTLIALALFMNIHKKMIALGADNGPTNVFARALDLQAQKRMAFIIPNGSKDTGEYDMRMEGEGKRYKHMLYDNCMVYKCENRLEQAEVIAMAYDDIIERDMHPIVYTFTIGKGDLKAVTLHNQ